MAELRPQPRAAFFDRSQRLALAYLGFGLAWVIGSDALLFALGKVNPDLLAFQLLKGSAFAVLSAFAIFLLLRYLSGERRQSAFAPGLNRLAAAASGGYLVVGLAAVFAMDYYLYLAGAQNGAFMYTQWLKGSAFVGISAFLVFLLARLPADTGPADAALRHASATSAGWEVFPVRVALVFGLVLLGLSLVLDTYEYVVSGEIGAGEFREHLLESLLLTAFAGLTLYALLRYVANLASRTLAGKLRSEQRYHSLFAHNPSGVCLVDREGRFIEANRAACDLFGLELDELLGGSFEPLIEPDQLDEIRQQFQSALRGEPRHYEARIRRPDGECRQFEVTNVPRYENGEVAGVYGVFRDVTLERTYADRISASEARFRALFEHSPDAVMLTRPDGVIEAANPAAQAMLGMSEAEIARRGRDGIVDTADPTLAELLAERERTGRTRGILRYRRADGTTFPVEITSARFDDAEGNARSFVIAQDVSERKRFEAALSASEARHRAVFEHSMEGLLLLTSDGGILGANPAAREIFRMSEEELKAKGRTGITDQDDPAVHESIAERQSTGRSRAVVRMIRGDGERFSAEISAVQFRSADGEDLVSVAVRDVTEQREREAQLASSEARYRELYYSHPDAVLELDPEGRIIQVNDAVARLVGYAPDELIGGGFDHLLHPEDLPRTWEHFRAVVGGETRSFKVRGVRENGQVFWAQVIGVPRHERGTLVGAAAIVRDIDAEFRARKDLEDSEARYRILYEQSPDAVLLVDAETGVNLDANPAAEALFGLARDELIGRIRMSDKDIGDPAFRAFVETRQREGRARGVLRLRRGDGGDFPADVISTTFRSREDRLLAITTIRDISEQVRREEELRASEERFRALFEQSAEAIFLTEPGGRIFAANRAAQALFGYSEEELCALGRSGLVDPEEPALLELLEERRTSNQARAEIHMRRRDGSWLLADISVMGFKDPAGRDRTSVVLRDVTERRRQEQVLRESEERFRAIYEHSPDPILHVDPDTGQILAVNAAAERVYGRSRDAFLALDRAEHVKIDEPAFRDFLEERKRTGHARAVLTMFRGDGTSFPADVTSATYLDSEGRERATAIVRDITEQREREALIRASEERYRALFEESIDAIFISDAETRVVVAANPAAQSLFLLDEPEICARPAEQALDLDDPATAEYFRARERDGQARARLRMRRGDGTWFSAEVTSRLFRTADGRLMANTIIRDVTEQEEYERQITESEERFRIVADNTGQAIYEIDLESGDAVWAGACQAMFGFGPDELSALGPRQRLLHVPESERDRVAATYSQAAKEGGSFHLEYPLVTRDLREIRVEDWGIVLKERGRIYGVIQDVTEQHRLTRELEERERALSEVSRVQQAILDALPAHIALLDEDGKILYVNAAWRRFARDNDFLGGDAGVGSNYLAVCDSASGREAETARETARGIRQVMEGLREQFGIEYPCHSRDERHWFRLAVTPFHSGERTGAVVAHVDVSDRREAERQLELVAAAFRSADEAILICNANFEILDVNHAYERITGRSRDDTIGNRPLFLEIEQQERNIRRALQAEGQWHGELLQRRQDGKVFVSRAAVNEVEVPESREPHLVVNFEDISELREYERKVDYLSYHDTLTGLPNRLALTEWFHSKESHDEAADSASPMIIAYVDLDRLKTVNDAYGHKVGDELITEIGHRLRELCEGDDYVARLIGDEFVMVISDVPDMSEALQVVRQRMARLVEPVKRGDYIVHPTVCAGIALAPEHGSSLEELLRKADVAMHEAKRHGRGEVVLFSAEMTEEVEQQLLIERQLRSGIENREFLLHYQPSVRLESGQVMGLEALVRWENPELGLVPPSRFIPVAEDSGLIIDLGDWVFEEVCRQIEEWRTADIPFGWVAVNLSPIQFQDPDLLTKVRAAMERHGVRGSQLRVEITENVLVMDPDWTIRVLGELRDLDIKIAVDDFGTGYSSLAYLKRFPVDFVKLDKTFVAGLPDDAADASIVGSVIELSRRLGMRVVAEGIERETQLHFLRDAGCQEAQGYYFSLPLRADDIPWLLKSHRKLPVSSPKPGRA